MSQKDMWANEVLEKRFSFNEGGSSMVGAKWGFSADIVNTSQLLFLLKCDDQCERLPEVLDILFKTIFHECWSLKEHRRRHWRARNTGGARVFCGEPHKTTNVDNNEVAANLLSHNGVR